MKQTLENGKAVMSYDPDATETINVFDGRDKVDENNLPCCYSKTRRGHAKAWAALKAAWNDSTTMYGACGILREHGIRMHTWCSMD